MAGQIALGTRGCFCYNLPSLFRQMVAAGFAGVSLRMFELPTGWKERCLVFCAISLCAQITVAQQSAPIPKAAAKAPQNRLQAPSFVPLNTAHQQYLDKVLTYWQSRTDKVKTYRCEFERWEFDTVFGPANTFKTYGTGEIKYSDPDKGLFKVSKVLTYTPPAAGQKPKYTESANVHGEHWICDGQSVFEFDYQNKRLVQQVLPPAMRGKAIADGPLPFMFGANAEDIKKRYWLQVITPSTSKGEYWLEAYPKTMADTGSFLKVHIIISEKDFLPKGLVVFDRNFKQGKNHSRTVFNFKERETNFGSTLDKLNIFHRSFYEPAVPKGWKKEIRQDQPVAGPGPQSRQVRQPRSIKPR